MSNAKRRYLQQVQDLREAIIALQAQGEADGFLAASTDGLADVQGKPAMPSIEILRTIGGDPSRCDFCGRPF